MSDDVTSRVRYIVASFIITLVISIACVFGLVKFGIGEASASSKASVDSVSVVSDTGGVRNGYFDAVNQRLLLSANQASNAVMVASDDASDDFDFVIPSEHAFGNYTLHDTGVVNEWQPGYYAAHDYTYYGRLFAQMDKGDKVNVDGRIVTIDGVMEINLDDSYRDVRTAVGYTKACFQTCIGDNKARVAYGSVEGGGWFPGCFDENGVYHDMSVEDELIAEYDSLSKEHTELENTRVMLDEWEGERGLEYELLRDEYEARCDAYEQRLADYDKLAAQLR